MNLTTKFIAAAMSLLIFTTTAFAEGTTPDLYTASDSLISDIKCDVDLIYDGNYTERILIKNKQITVPVKITNTGNEERTVVCYIGEYNKAGAVIDTAAGPAISVAAGQSAETSITKTAAKRRQQRYLYGTVNQ